MMFKTVYLGVFDLDAVKDRLAMYTRHAADHGERLESITQEKIETKFGPCYVVRLELSGPVPRP